MILELEPAAQRRDPLAHAHDPEPAQTALLGVKTAAVVFDLDLERPGSGLADRDRDARRPAMPQRIADPLADDPIDDVVEIAAEGRTADLDAEGHVGMAPPHALHEVEKRAFE